MMRKTPLSLHVPADLIAKLEAERERMSDAAGTAISRNAAMAAVLQRGLANNEPTKSQK
jgi:hypothetical protein